MVSFCGNLGWDQVFSSNNNNNNIVTNSSSIIISSSSSNNPYHNHAINHRQKQIIINIFITNSRSTGSCMTYGTVQYRNIIDFCQKILYHNLNASLLSNETIQNNNNNHKPNSRVMGKPKGGVATHH